MRMKPRLILAIVLCFSAVCPGQGLLPESWYVRNSPTTNALNGIVYGGVFMAVGDSATVLISSDGSHWTSGPTPGTSADFLFAAYAPVGYAYLVGGAGGAFASRDGGNWTNVLSTAAATQLFGAAYYYTHGYQVVAW